MNHDILTQNGQFCNISKIILLILNVCSTVTVRSNDIMIIIIDYCDNYSHDILWHESNPTKIINTARGV